MDYAPRQLAAAFAALDSWIGDEVALAVLGLETLARLQVRGILTRRELLDGRLVYSVHGDSVLLNFSADRFRQASGPAVSYPERAINGEWVIRSSVVLCSVNEEVMVWHAAPATPERTVGGEAA